MACRCDRTICRLDGDHTAYCSESSMLAVTGCTVWGSAMCTQKYVALYEWRQTCA